jgi:hypothetical protein
VTASLPRRRRPQAAERGYIMDSRRYPRLGESRWELPVIGEGRVRAIARGAASGLLGASAQASKIDRFVVSSTAVVGYALTYVPVFDSWNISINGVTQEDSVDYTVAGRVVTFADSDLLRVGDLIEAQYDWRIAGPVTALFPEFLAATSTTGPYGTDLTLPPVDGGNLIVVGAQTASGDAADTPSGWTKVETADDGNYTHITLFEKTSDGTETIFHLASGATTGGGPPVLGGGFAIVAAVYDSGSISAVAHSTFGGSTSYAQPRPTVPANALALHFTATQGLSGTTVTDLGSDVNVRKRENRSGSAVGVALGDWQAPAGVEPTQTAHGSDNWVGISAVIA